jgi:signal transduction histidine kinase
VRSTLAYDDPTLALDIHDDGVGFDSAGEFPGHLGLRSMRERMSALGGRLDIESAPGHGTRTRATIAVRRPPSSMSGRDGRSGSTSIAEGLDAARGQSIRCEHDSVDA